jgi:hypothetical protein
VNEAIHAQKRLDPVSGLHFGAHLIIILGFIHPSLRWDRNVNVPENAVRWSSSRWPCFKPGKAAIFGVHRTFSGPPMEPRLGTLPISMNESRPRFRPPKQQDLEIFTKCEVHTGRERECRDDPLKLRSFQFGNPKEKRAWALCVSPPRPPVPAGQSQRPKRASLESAYAPAPPTLCPLFSLPPTPTPTHHWLGTLSHEHPLHFGRHWRRRCRYAPKRALSLLFEEESLYSALLMLNDSPLPLKTSRMTLQL